MNIVDIITTLASNQLFPMYISVYVLVYVRKALTDLVKEISALRTDVQTLQKEVSNTEYKIPLLMNEKHFCKQCITNSKKD